MSAWDRTVVLFAFHLFVGPIFEWNAHEDTNLWRCSDNKHCQNWCKCKMIIFSRSHTLPSTFGHLSGAYRSRSSTQGFLFWASTKMWQHGISLARNSLCGMLTMPCESKKSWQKTTLELWSVLNGTKKITWIIYFACWRHLTFFVKELTWRWFFGGCLNLLPKAAWVSLCPRTEAN